MAIVKRNYGDLLSMHDRIHRFFEDAFRDFDNERESLTAWSPVTDIYETKDNYVFKLEVPGIAREDIKIELENNMLSIRGEKKEEKEVKKENYHRIESYSGSFSRSFSLPRNVDVQKIEASMKDGVLELHLAKSEEKKARAISIN